MKPYEEIAIAKTEMYRELDAINASIESIIKKYKEKTGGSVKDILFFYHKLPYGGEEYDKYEITNKINFYE